MERKINSEPSNVPGNWKVGRTCEGSNASVSIASGIATNFALGIPTELNVSIWNLVGT
jgi:hypothetical protein